MEVRLVGSFDDFFKAAAAPTADVAPSLLASTGADNAYTTVKPTLTRRHILALVGGRDPICPAAGGVGRIFGISFVHWEYSAYGEGVVREATCDVSTPCLRT